MKRILITGFGPFGLVEKNPSTDAARQLHEILALESQLEIIPTEYQTAIERGRDLGQQPFELMILFGFSRRVTSIRFDTVASNHITSPYPDHAGIRMTNERLAPLSGPDFLAADAQLSTTLSDALRSEGVPATVSPSPTNYVCNALLYAVIHARLEATGSADGVVFCHVGRSDHQLIARSIAKTLMRLRR